MPIAMEILGGQVTAPSTTLTALSMFSGNSLTVRNAKADSAVRLMNLWADNQSAGTLRVRSPDLHDNVQGIRLQVAASEPYPLLPGMGKQHLTPQDQLIVELSGSATAGDIEQAFLLVHYEDLPGIEGRFLTFDEFESLACELVTVENTLSLGTAGGWSGEESLKAEYDLLRANTDYAVLGYVVSAECGAIRYRGTDFGNLGIGGPGLADAAWLTREWFVNLARQSGLPTIPIINSANMAAILVDGATDENGTDVTVSTILCMLGSGRG